MKQPRLSILIPTYNRASYLQETINNLIKEIDETSLVEIIIQDNASTDETNQICSYYTQIYTFLKYYRNEVNLGFDANALLGLHHAQGEFVWFLGDDDKIKEGGISYVIKIITREKNLAALCINSSLYDRELKKIIIDKKIKINEDQIYNNHNDALFNLNFNLCYLSGLILKREYCLKIEDASFYLGTGFIHFYLALNVLLKGNCYYVSQPFVIQRGENAPEFDKVHVFIYGLNSILRKARKLGYSNKAINKFLDINIITASIETLRALTKNEETKKLLPIFISGYWSRPLFWFLFFPMFLIPSFLLKIIHKLGRLIKKITRKFYL
jgi:abequosyltransferase